ncbi:glycosyltransferase family 2 protein [Aurantiacibacter spongiae]|uniref:Glycosyltransferase family 2 protein n=1 Tax=Aurantiacibacter spongiae TaxID=2488860 RepID=A0A3N5DNB3_9SPHN|nr:glycosyltransferase family 2 protein [Aurantiacibacter spongiae]RPF70531.1 glycosyltransferase family 2 protein [Aurantiacibacter spongiae]
MNDPRVTTIILTKNEERHLRRAIASVAADSDSVIVLDSGSTDATEAIAREMGARFETNPWVNHAAQFNHGLRLVDKDAEWVLRLDADEILEKGWYRRFAEQLADRPGAAGFTFTRTMTFRGKPIRRGLARTRQLRLFRAGLGRCEARWMDEHIVVDGPVAKLDIELLDDNLNDLAWWTDKHQAYANREAIELLLNERREESTGLTMTRQARIKRWIKDRIYRRLPSGLRALAFFLLRYVFALGFLDGRRGFQFHVLQGFWYRLYVDIRIEEIEALMRREGIDLPAAIRSVTGIAVGQVDDVAKRPRTP